MENKHASLGRLLSDKSQVGMALNKMSNNNVNNAGQYLLFPSCHTRILLHIVYKKSVLSDQCSILAHRVCMMTLQFHLGTASAHRECSPRSVKDSNALLNKKCIVNRLFQLLD